MLSSPENRVCGTGAITGAHPVQIVQKHLRCKYFLERARSFLNREAAIGSSSIRRSSERLAPKDSGKHPSTSGTETMTTVYTEPATRSRAGPPARSCSPPLERSGRLERVRQ